MVDALLAAGAEVDATTNDSWTPLHEAALNGQAPVLARLLEAGAQARLSTLLQLLRCREF
jgi:ankyrin repeat protein